MLNSPVINALINLPNDLINANGRYILKIMWDIKPLTSPDQHENMGLSGAESSIWC